MADVFSKVNVRFGGGDAVNNYNLLQHLQHGTLATTAFAWQTNGKDGIPLPSASSRVSILMLSSLRLRMLQRANQAHHHHHHHHPGQLNANPAVWIGSHHINKMVAALAGPRSTTRRSETALLATNASRKQQRLAARLMFITGPDPVWMRTRVTLRIDAFFGITLYSVMCQELLPAQYGIAARRHE